MSTKYAQNANGATTALIGAAVQALAVMMQPYRSDVVISRKIFGIFTVNITVGEIVDWLVQTFGSLGLSGTTGQPVAPPPV